MRWLLLLLVSTCACSSPIAATETPQDAIVTVRVMQYAAQTEPIKGALVQVNGHVSGRTDESGVARITAVCDTWVDIRAEAEGYVGFSAAGVVRNPETWTFWLEAR